MIGKTISHYKIIDQLGSGGMGVVDKAQHLKLDRNVAIKFIPLSLSLDEEAKKRFIHEAKTAYSLDHPNIFIIHEIDEMEDKHLFIVLAYCEGEILEQMISKGSFQLYVSVNYTKQVAEALNLIEKTKGTGFNCDYGTLYKVLLNDPFCKKLQNESRFKEVVEYQKEIYQDYISMYGSDNWQDIEPTKYIN